MLPNIYFIAIYYLVLVNLRKISIEFECISERFVFRVTLVLETCHILRLILQNRNIRTEMIK